MPSFGLPGCHPNQNPLKSERLSSVSVFVSFGFVMALTSCGMVQNNIAATRGGSELTTLSKVTPIAAKPNELVSLTGRNFLQEKNLKVSLELANGERASVPLTITDSKTGSFAMPEGAGLGLKDVKLTQGSGGSEVTSFNLIADQASNQLPIIVGDGSAVCSDQKYIDRNGDQQTGTKDCAASTVKICTGDGEVGCVTTSTFKSADLTNLTAGNIKSGVTIAGTAGQYPSTSFPLDSSSVVVADLSEVQATREGQLRSATNFEFFKSDGTRVQAQGDADITGLNIANSVNIFGQAGSATLSPGDCFANGQQGCVVNGSYFAGTMCLGNDSNCFIDDFGGPTNLLKAVNYSSILTNASNIRSGVTISDVTGTLDDCSANAVTGCVTTTTYQSADLTNLSAGNIKSGVTIAGQLGNYPSATSPLAGSSGSDLTSETFNAQIKSSGTFQYFGSDGSRYTGTGDTDIDATNIVSDVDIFGTEGTTASAVAPDPWDVRVGKTINGVPGKLKVNCRNRANTSVFDIDQGQAATITIGSPGSINITSHGLTNGTMVRINYSSPPTGLNNSTTYYVVNSAANTFNLSATSGGAAIAMTTAAGANVTVQRWQASPTSVEIWDTIDDLNNSVSGLPPSVVTAWGNNTDCGGVETAAGDDNVWKDVTTAGTGAASCTGSPERCTMQDKITGLWWSRLQANAAWWQAVTNCQSLNHNGQTGWRLPTQKELMEAYTHGIRSAARTNWMTEANMNTWFWSGSSVSSSTRYAWDVYLAKGLADYAGKESAGQVVCVR